jgi:hypothetical protein
MMSRDRNIEIGRAVTDLVRMEGVKTLFVEAAKEAKAILLADASKLSSRRLAP